jgi:hypothetical protein
VAGVQPFTLLLVLTVVIRGNSKGRSTAAYWTYIIRARFGFNSETAASRVFKFSVFHPFSLRAGFGTFFRTPRRKGAATYSHSWA